MNHRVVLSALLLLTACDQQETVPLKPATVRSSLRETARLHARDGARLVTDFVAGGFMDRALDGVCGALENAAPDCSTPEINLEPADVDDAIDELLEKYFADDRVISETETEVIYAIRSAEICGDDAECIADLDQLSLQLVASQPSPGNIDLILRASGHNVFVLNLHQDSVSLEGDLGELRAVVAEHPQVFDLEEQDVPMAAGRIRATITRLSARHYQGDLTVTQDIAIRHTDSSGTYELTVDAATLLAVDADADAESLVATLGIDRVSASLPANALDFLFDESFGGGIAQIELGGLTASADLANLERQLSITGVSLGQTTSSFALDGIDLLTVDLNQDFGRELGVTVTATDDRWDISVDPAAALRSHLHLQPLVDRGQDVPAWALDSENEARFTAAQGLPSVAAGDEYVRIENGMLELSSSAMDAPVVIGAGMCVAADDSLDIDQVHPFATVYGSVCQ